MSSRSSVDRAPAPGVREVMGSILAGDSDFSLSHARVVLINRSFPCYLVPLFQNESNGETIAMKIPFICMKIKLHAELIFI